MSSGFNHKQPKAIIDTEAGQLEALALAAKFVGTLGSLLTDKDGIKNVNDALADFDKKHAEHKNILAENRMIVTEIGMMQEQLDKRASDIEAAHVASMGDIEALRQKMLDDFDDGMEKATAKSNEIIQARIDKLDAREARLVEREQIEDRHTKQIDHREANLHQLEDKLKAIGKAHDDRQAKLDAHAKKLDTRHDEVAALEKNALKG